MTKEVEKPETAGAGLPLVSVIIPCHNAMPWLDECLASCASQDYEGPLEVSVFDDVSTAAARRAHACRARLPPGGVALFVSPAHALALSLPPRPPPAPPLPRTLTLSLRNLRM